MTEIQFSQLSDELIQYALTRFKSPERSGQPIDHCDRFASNVIE